MDVAGLAHLVWLVLLIAVGFPVALGIELYLRGGTWWKSREEHESLYNAAFMKVPEDSAIARRMREPVRAALPEPE